MESHLPYSGFDYDYYYDPIPPNVLPHTDAHRAARWIRVNKYTDRYLVKETLEFLRKNEPNTIFIMTGDHSSRDLPNREKWSKIGEKSQFEGSCVHGSTGPDVYFSTAGFISYLGNDTRIKNALQLDQLAGKTYKFACDYNDLVYTLFEIIGHLSGKRMMPSYRRSRNLIDLAKRIDDGVKANGTKVTLNELDKEQWKSISTVTYQMEYHRGTKFLRTHAGNPKGSLYTNASVFPTCITSNNKERLEVGSSVAQELYHEMFKSLGAENYLTYHNRMYNFKFGDEECVKNGKCEFPEPGKDVDTEDWIFYIVIFGFPIGFMFCVGLPAITISFVKELKVLKDEDKPLLEENIDLKLA